MKTRSKALLLTLCAVLLVTASVLGTLAFLTSTDKVENTFSVGQVQITLDEKDTDNSTPGADRDQANAYHLLPGHAYEKDPTVHVDPVSEDSWIFVKVENGISAYEAATVEGGYTSIADQITANGWMALTGVDGVYYKAYDKSTAGTELVVFSNFKIADEANKVTGWADLNAKVTVTGYAVQKDGFDTPLAAWNATFGKTN